MIPLIIPHMGLQSRLGMHLCWFTSNTCRRRGQSHICTQHHTHTQNQSTHKTYIKMYVRQYSTLHYSDSSTPRRGLEHEMTPLSHVQNLPLRRRHCNPCKQSNVCIWVYHNMYETCALSISTNITTKGTQIHIHVCVIHIYITFAKGSTIHEAITLSAA